jgi:hypothetical protein
VGSYISPHTERREVIATSIEAYFDELGPGELVASTDPRWHRAHRFPDPTEEAPQRAGANVTSWLAEGIGGALIDAVLEDISDSMPAVPADPITGPERITLGRVSISAF